jgi:ribosomal protein L12E/L44/L45/RPP1/RPP2
VPKVGDAADTTVYRYWFHDGVPVDVAEDWLVFKLQQNPWFHVGDEPAPVSERALALAHDARVKADEMRVEADQLDPAPRGAWLEELNARFEASAKAAPEQPAEPATQVESPAQEQPAPEQPTEAPAEASTEAPAGTVVH